MMSALLADILTFPLLVAELASGAMKFSTEAFRRAATNAEAQTAAVFIAFFAGVSEMLGQSVILVINRTPLYRFLASLAFTGATYVVTALTWAACAIAIAPLTGESAFGAVNIAAISGVVFLAFAPRLLGVFSIAPYFGVALGNLLEVWAMMLAIFGLHAALDLSYAAAAVCGGAGWVVSFGLRSFFGRVLNKPLARLRVLVSGSALERSPQQLIDEIRLRARSARRS
ncbi:MAG: hypothetical protein AAGA09_08135 [Pseudomonadota bacterium]